MIGQPCVVWQMYDVAITGGQSVILNKYNWL